MRIIRYSLEGKTSWGVVSDEGVVDLGSRSGTTLDEALQTGCMESLARQHIEENVDCGLNDICFERPIAAPEKIICIGVNYAHRNAEYRDGSEAPKNPSVFMRTPDSLVGHRQPMLRPPESEQLDYEGEIVVVIGKEGRRISRESALSHVAGYTLMNEGSIRDWLRHAKFNVTQGKNFVASGSCGPWIVTADELSVDAVRDLHLTTRVNGELRQDDTTANLMFPFDFLISYLSTFYHLKPGDLIATGTPNGAGARFDPPRYLVPGDEVVISVDGIGQLSNPIEDEF